MIEVILTISSFVFSIVAIVYVHMNFKAARTELDVVSAELDDRIGRLNSAVFKLGAAGYNHATNKNAHDEEAA